MVRTKSFLNNLLVSLIFLGVGACKLGDVEFDGINTPVYEAQVSVAMAEANYSLTDLILGIKDSSLRIVEAPNGLISIIYEDSAEFRFAGQELLILMADPSVQQEVQLQDRTIPMEFFNEFETGRVDFEFPKISYTVDNTYGVELGLAFDVNSERDDLRNLTFDSEILAGEITNELRVIAAAPPEDVGVTPKRTSVTITPDNSNLSDLFSILPLILNNGLRATVNPNNEPVTGNVVGSNAGVKIKTRIELPLRAVVDSLVTIIDFNMNMGLSFEESDSVTLRIVTLNSTPLDGLLVMEFFDMDSLKIYDVPQSLAFTAATVGPRDKTVDPEIFIDDIPLDSTGVRALANTAYINAFVAMNSFKLDTRDMVSFFSNYELDIVVTAIVQVNEEF